MQQEQRDVKRKAREGQRHSRPVNAGLWQEPDHVRPRLVAVRAQEPAVSFAALKMMTMTSEEKSEPKRCVDHRLLSRQKVLMLKTVSLGFWVCQEVQGSGD